jgi:hypothetical protein
MNTKNVITVEEINESIRICGDSFGFFIDYVDKFPLPVYHDTKKMSDRIKKLSELCKSCNCTIVTASYSDYRKEKIKRKKNEI